MINLERLISSRLDAFAACYGLWLICVPLSASAQQMGIAGTASNTGPAGVPLEYATIGGVQLPITILRSDGVGVSGSGQVASNSQVGNNNRTVIDQGGQGNRAGVVTVGDGNTATISQTGRDNVGQGTLVGSGLVLNLSQDGTGNQANLGLSSGTGGSLTVQQSGNGNVATGIVPGGVPVTVIQSGNGLSADVTQAGVQKGFSVTQVGRR